MELKDVILSTLAEMEGDGAQNAQAVPEVEQPTERERQEVPLKTSSDSAVILEDERRFLESVKERLLVLFEGFQSPNNSHLEAKVDLTLNFLEYLLATIDTRIDHIKQSER